MTELDTPAIGRKIKYLMHHDRATLIAILRGTQRELWPALADAYIQALGTTEAADRQASVPGVVYVWTQLVKEAGQ